MKRILLLLFAFLYIYTTGRLSAQTGGTNTYQFLNLAIPARVAALGGTLISVKDKDINLSFQNPALLDSTMHNSLAISYVDYFSDIKYGYSAYSRTYRKVGSFSAGIQFLDYGKFTSASIYGDITGQFTAAEYAFNLAYARPLDSMFSVGGTVKTIYSKLNEFTSVGNAVDVGAIYNNKRRLLSAAFVVKNVGRQWQTYNLVRESLPFELELGFSKKLRHAPFRWNLTATHLEKWDLTYVDPSISTTDPITGKTIEKSKISILGDKLARHFVFGGEILLTQNFNIRVGYNYLRRQELKLESHPGIAGFSFGFGLKLYKFHFSYGYAKYHVAGGPNHFTISTNLSEFYSRKS